MAGASMNDIKARIKSVESTRQITKAMELVATSKLRRAKEKAESTRPFHEVLRKAIDGILTSDELRESVWCEEREAKRTLYIVIAGDRGLAGGYNANIFRLGETLSASGESVFLPVGKKALEYYRHRKRELLSEELSIAAAVGVGDAIELAGIVCDAYESGEIDRVVLIYTRFVSMLTQLPVYEQLLPLERKSNEVAASPETDCEPEELLRKIVSSYVGGVIYSALTESVASESGARRMAMSAANKNATEMIDSLMLSYNRARQAIITQEITEIISGSEAL